VSSEVVVLPFPARVQTARHARSTLIMASIKTVQKRGLFDAYQRALDPAHRATLLEAVAATWMPLDAAAAHYAACDTLGLDADQQTQCGRSTFDESRGTILGTAVRMAKSAGMTPWQGFTLLQRFWDRGFDGGGVSVTRIAPKDAHITVVHCPLMASPYFRNGLRGLCAALAELFCLRVYVVEKRSTSSSVTFHVQWA
jgi:hypothetical protein